MTKLIALVVMGVSGSGKSTVGARVADRLSWDFVDGDDLHPPSNVAKMAAGVPLTDADRAPWLADIHALLASRVASGTPTVVACSALRRSYRDQLRADLPPGSIAFAYLEVDRPTLEARLRRRHAHYMPPSLLDSQLATLEPPGPDEALIIDASRPLPETVDHLVQALTPP